MINLEGLLKNSMTFVKEAESRFFSLDPVDRESDHQRFIDDSKKYDADNKWALYVFPNSNEYMARSLMKMKVGKDDIILDIGAGDARLSIMALQELGIKKAYALELNKDWYNKTMKYLKNNGGIPEGLVYLNIAYQDFYFPDDITKAVFLAWHNGDKTRESIIMKLRQTQCSVFGHNFGDSNKIYIDEVTDNG